MALEKEENGRKFDRKKERMGVKSLFQEEEESEEEGKGMVGKRGKREGKIKKKRYKKSNKRRKKEERKKERGRKGVKVKRKCDRERQIKRSNF